MRARQGQGRDDRTWLHLAIRSSFQSIYHTHLQTHAHIHTHKIHNTQTHTLPSPPPSQHRTRARPWLRLRTQTQTPPSSPVRVRGRGCVEVCMSVCMCMSVLPVCTEVEVNGPPAHLIPLHSPHPPPLISSPSTDEIPAKPALEDTNSCAWQTGLMCVADRVDVRGRQG